MIYIVFPQVTLFSFLLARKLFPEVMPSKFTLEHARIHAFEIYIIKCREHIIINSLVIIINSLRKILQLKATYKVIILQKRDLIKIINLNSSMSDIKNDFRDCKIPKLSRLGL